MPTKLGWARVAMDHPNVRIYVLCHNEERLASAQQYYAKYYWAHPIIMKYQDSTFENAFWRQLLEIQDEWINCDMVGTISSSAFKKISIDKIDSIIRNLRDNPTRYHPFITQNSLATWHHPHCATIITDVCKSLSLPVPTVGVFSNYWICRPKYMVTFIKWYHDILLPAVLAHPLIRTDSTYNGQLTTEELQKLCGVPYYPHTPFVLERLNAMYFLNELYWADQAKLDPTP